MRGALLVWLMLVGGPAAALGPLERNHPDVAEGMDAYERGDFESALRSFSRAQGELPRSPVVEFNRGNALHKLGRYPEASEAYARALELDKDGQLAAQDYYNLGNNFAAMGSQREAVAAYRKALRLDPGDAQARHNLEVLLRNLPPPNSSAGPDGGVGDGGAADGGGKQGADGGRLRPDGGSSRGDGGQGDGGEGRDRADAGDAGGQAPRAGDGGSKGSGDGGRGDARSDGGSQEPSGGQPDGGSLGADGGSDAGVGFAESDRGDGGSGGEAAISKRDAEKLLDAMRQNEKNLQLWRFQQKKPRKRDEKDW